MEKLDKVELVREKCNVSYEEAREALVTNDYDVLDAIIWLERQGKTTQGTAHYTTDSHTGEKAPEPTPTQIAISQIPNGNNSRFEERMDSVWDGFKRLVRAGIENNFVAEKEGARVFSIPVLVVVLGLFLWGASLILLIVGLFCGLRYHIEGKHAATVDVNDVMDRAADTAETIKHDFTGK